MSGSNVCAALALACRWEEVRKWFGPLTWQLFNVGFIALFQNLLLLLIVTPTYFAWVARGKPIGESSRQPQVF
jgi:steroid 5-alpha reductase family enzyme